MKNKYIEATLQGKALCIYTPIMNIEKEGKLFYGSKITPGYNVTIY